jgi:predicted nucleotidyltransferase
MVVGRVDLSLEVISEICSKYQIRELSVFGSALRDDFGPNSDIDVLVEFIPGHTIGLIEYIGCQMDLSQALGRRVDLVSKNSLDGHMRKQILESSRVIYAV